MTFEWDNRDVQRYNLFQHLTPTIYWHYVSNQYFPLNFYETAQNFEEYFEDEVRDKLCNKEITLKDMMSLYNLDVFKDRVAMGKEMFMTEQLIETSAHPITKDGSNEDKNKDTDKINEKEKNDPNNIESMIKFLERHYDKIKSKNDSLVHEMSQKLQNVYDPIQRRENEDEIWNEYHKTGMFPDNKMKLWNLKNMNDFENDIYNDVAAIYLEDCSQNLQDYVSDPKNLLVDTHYCTKMEEDYLRLVAQKHQEKNESHSKKLKERINDVQQIFQTNSDVDKNKIIQSHPVTVSLLNERRKKEEDAKCLICNSGDYEENDLIVF